MTAQKLLTLARNKGVMIATAESCTAGLLAGAITDIPGSSAIFDRGFVTYTNAAKIEMLGVKTVTLEAFGAVSEQVAQEMAKGALANSNAQIAVAVTGIAGPDGSEHKPEGRVCFAISIPSATVSETIEFGAIGRTEVRAASVGHGLDLLIHKVMHF